MEYRMEQNPVVIILYNGETIENLRHKILKTLSYETIQFPGLFQ